MKITEIKQGNTKSGKPMETLILDDSEIKSLNIFEWDEKFMKVKVGDEISRDELVKDGNYWNFKRDKPQSGGTQGNRGGMIAKAQDTKREDIKNAQENKEKGIMLSSTIRMAVDLTTGQITPNMTTSEVKQRIRGWRYWLMSIWDDDNWQTQEPPFTEKVAGTDMDYPVNDLGEPAF